MCLIFYIDTVALCSSMNAVVCDIARHGSATVIMIALRVNKREREREFIRARRRRGVTHNS